MDRIPRSFFGRYTPTVARDLLGSTLVRVRGGRRLSGRIVETEAYRGEGDPASHAWTGRNARNEMMFGEPGKAYVYFTMGLHHCLNITTEPGGRPGAVLIRAIEPVEGVEEMMRYRGVEEWQRIANGPGNLTVALGIGRTFNGEDLVSSERLFLERGGVVGQIGATSRVGIRKATGRKWRFFVADSPYVSRGRPALTPQNP